MFAIMLRCDGVQSNKLDKYVNMADINIRNQQDAATVALIELFFFAYRDFVAEPDELLAELGFGRAHHRVLHFVGRDPGMTVAQLLDILRITKQSLGRVLKELIDKGYVEQREGEHDRRQRLLFLTRQGDQLRQRLMAPQVARIRRALAEAQQGEGTAMRAMFQHLINPENREGIEGWIARADGKHHG
jgi:DNA-binding MarR family transcriptional regulator